MSDTDTDGDEKILWSGSVSQWHYAGKWVFILILIAALAGTFFVNLADDPSLVWKLIEACA